MTKKFKKKFSIEKCIHSNNSFTQILNSNQPLKLELAFVFAEIQDELTKKLRPYLKIIEMKKRQLEEEKRKLKKQKPQPLSKKDRNNFDKLKNYQEKDQEYLSKLQKLEDDYSDKDREYRLKEELELNLPTPFSLKQLKEGGFKEPPVAQTIGLVKLELIKKFSKK